MRAITVHKLLHIETSPSGPARLEVELSGRPHEAWIEAFRRQVHAAPSELLAEADLFAHRHSVKLTTKVALTPGNDRELIEWLHEVVAATNAELGLTADSDD
jgi:hypothetical protein